MSEVELIRVGKAFGGIEVIGDISLKVNSGELVVFVGPSGCGKSTLLRMICGLETLTRGDVLIDRVSMRNVDASQRGAAMVFQSYALYPHMTVAENMAFPLRMSGMARAKRLEKARAAAVLQITPLLDRKPAQLSGGQRQRVAIGRAIVRNPRVFLFDEPLSNLDAALRAQMRLELTELHARLQATMIYVTHDQVEAMTMADKIVVLNAGRIEQVGSPLDLYNQPRNTFVAGFIGSPKMNLITGAEASKQGATTIGVRPEHLDVVSEGGWAGVVGLSEHLGSDTFLKVETEAVGTINVRAGGEVMLRHGDKVHLSPQAGKIHRFGPDGMAI